MKSINEHINDLIIKPTGKLKSRLEEIELSIDIPNTKVKAYCHCVKINSRGQARVKDLINFLMRCILNYTIPRNQLNKARKYRNDTLDSSETLKLQQQAKGLFTHLTNTGEGGELLLHVIAQEILGKPQLLSKMPLKTSANMHYHGADGIYFDYDENTNNLSLYRGESKMYKDLNQAIGECVSSIKDFLLDEDAIDSKQERDLQLITSGLKDNIDNVELEDLLVRYFDRDDVLSNNIIYKGICFVGFDSTKYPTLAKPKTMEDLKNEIQKDLENRFSKISHHVSKHIGLEHLEIHFFLIPFPSVEQFRDYFIKTLK